jgi:hypothetical protein
MKTHINVLVNERQVVKLNASEIDVKTPNFRVLSCHSIVSEALLDNRIANKSGLLLSSQTIT